MDIKELLNKLKEDGLLAENTKLSTVERRYEYGKRLVKRALIPKMKSNDKYFEPVAICNNRVVALLDDDKANSFIYINDLVDGTLVLKHVIDNYDTVKQLAEKNEVLANIIAEFDELEANGIKKEDLIPINIVNALIETGLARPNKPSSLMIQLKITNDEVRTFWKKLFPNVDF